MLGGEGTSSAPLVVFSHMFANEFRGSCSYTLISRYSHKVILCAREQWL